jgi:hypothetical protein
VNRNWYQPASAVGARPLAGTGASGSPYFIVTFRDASPPGGTIQVQTHGQTDSTVVVRPGLAGCTGVYYGGGYQIEIAGPRPAGDITVNITGTNIAGDPAGGCRVSYDYSRGASFSIVIPAGSSSIDLPNLGAGFGTPAVYRLSPCSCSSPAQAGLAGTMTFTDPSGRVPTQTATFSITP